MVSPLKEIREDESLPSPFSNFHKYVCQKASRRKKGIHTNCEAGRHCFCVRFTSHKHIEIFFSSKMLKGNEEETRIFIGNLKRFLPSAIYQWSNICRSLHRDCRLVFLFLLSPNYLDESTCLNKELVHKKYNVNDNFPSKNRQYF